MRTARTGSFILIEQGSNATVAAGMLFAPLEAARPDIQRLRHLKTGQTGNRPDLLLRLVTLARQVKLSAVNFVTV